MSARPGAGSAFADDVLEITRRLAAAAAAGAWEQVDDLLDRRAPLVAALATLDRAGLAAGERAACRLALEEVVRLDASTAAATAAAHRAVGAQLGRLHLARRTLVAYAPERHGPLVIDRPG
jgi:hypothetical protein